MANYGRSIEQIFPWDVRIGLTTQLLLRLSMDRVVSFICFCDETLHLHEGGVIMVLLCLALAVLT